MLRILSLDISASTTGWAFTLSTPNSKFKFGTIKTSPKITRAQRLVSYRNDLIKTIDKLNPTHIVIEDVYSGLNVKTLVLLAKFAGVTEEVCLSRARIEPYIIHTNTVKAYFKAKNKENLFDFILNIFSFNIEKFKFKTHNDITDSLAQLLCYCDNVLECRKFRDEKEYGYLYGV